MQNIPVADAKPDDIKDLLGGALFQALYKWMQVSDVWARDGQHGGHRKWVQHTTQGCWTHECVCAGGSIVYAPLAHPQESGPVYLLPTGPVSSFLVISDPAAAKHVLRGTDNPTRNVYEKGLVAEVSRFLFGEGFAISGGEQWRARRRAVGPSLHRWGAARGANGAACSNTGAPWQKQQGQR